MSTDPKAVIKEQAQLVFNDYLPAIEKSITDKSGELAAVITKMDNRLDELQSSIDATNALVKSEKVTTGSDKGDRLSDDYTAIFTKALAGRRLSDAELTITADYQKSWNVSAATAAGYLVPTDFATDIMKQVEAQVPFMSLSTQRNTTFPSSAFMVQTGKGTAGVGTEVATSANTAEGTVQEVMISVYDIDAEPSLTRTLLEDAAFDVLGFIKENAADAIGDKFGAFTILGAGTTEPKGLLASANTTSTYAVIKVVTAATYDANNGIDGYFDADDLFEVKYDLDPRYAGNCSWVVARTALKTMRKLKDANGQYLWQPSLVVGAPASFDGDAVYQSPYVSTVADNAISAYYGDFKKGTAVVRHTGGSWAIVDEITSRKLVKVYLKERLGFGVVDARALRALKVRDLTP